MKKVLSVAMASAMVLGMGANAFAISYSTGSNDKADWPDNFEFAGSLFVTDKNGDLVKTSTTELNDNENVDFMAGDVIWMPLYADNQEVYDAEYGKEVAGKDSVANVRITDTIAVGNVTKVYKWTTGAYYAVADESQYTVANATYVSAGETYTDSNVECPVYYAAEVTVPTTRTLPAGYANRKVVDNSEKYYVGATRYKDAADFKAAIVKAGSASEAYITVDIAKEAGSDEYVGKPSISGKKDGLYTGKIDKNWSINLIEDTKGVAELIEKVELYKATSADYASYNEHAFVDIQPNAVFVRVHLKDEWKSAKDETLKYHVYVANNAGKTTNKVWVEGTYAGMTAKTVDFNWPNDASKPAVWEAKENGVATFDFADKAYFTVKMYKGEKLYLDMASAFDKTVDGDLHYTADAFYTFVDGQGNNNFYREGELVLVNDNENLVVYNVTEDGYEVVDAEYVENKQIAQLGKKVNGFVFSTKQLGNYVVAEEIEEEVVEEEVDEIVEEETDDVVEDVVEVETDKPNPETGAEDFVGLAVSLAVVSVAAAGALALKK